MNPETSWVEPEMFDDRIDASFYGPEHLHNDLVLKSAPFGAERLRMYLKRVFKGAFYILSSEYRDAGIPFLRVTEITQGYVDTSQCTHLDPMVHNREKKTAVEPGYLLFAKGGSIGNCAVVPASLPEANISQDLIGAVTKVNLDPYYACAFLNSRLGVSQMKRWAQGNVHPHITNDAVKNIFIPLADGSIQHAVGNKLRKAERLREKAFRKQDEVNARIEELFGRAEWNSHRPYGWMTPGFFEASRLDAWFYQPSYREMARLLKGRSDLIPVSRIAQLACEIVDFTKCPGSQFEYFEIADLEIESGSISSKLVDVTEAPSRAKYRVAPGDVLVSTVRPNRKGVALVPNSARFAVCSSGFSALRCSTKALAHYLRACFAQDIATDQLMRWNTGATYPAIDREVPLGILVPWPGEAIACELGAVLEEIANDFTEVQRLVDEAITDIEALVAGTIEIPLLIRADQEIGEWLNQNPLEKRSA